MALPSIRRHAAIAALATGLVATGASAQQASIDDVRRLVEAGRSEEAWPLGLAIDRVAAAQADLWCGVAEVAHRSERCARGGERPE